MEQRVLNTRTVKTIGCQRAGELHDGRARLAALRVAPHVHQLRPAGAQGRRGAVDQPRGALGPLVGAHRALERRPRGGTTSSLTCRSAPTTSSSRSTGTASCASLVAYVLIFIKHIPSCQPNLSYANMLCNKWYEILWTEYNLPRPSKRKKIKLRMMLELFAAESAVFEKFGHARVGHRLPGHAPGRRRATCRRLHRAAGGRRVQPAALPRPRGDPQRLVALARPLAGHRRRTSSR